MGHRVIAFAAALGLSALLAVPVRALPLFRISLENAPAHVQVRAVRRFAERVAEATRGSVEVQVYDDAKMFRDRDVVPALASGKVEMAVPGTWQLDRYEPSVGVFLLPAFYGRGAAWVHRQVDGPLGREVSRKLELSTGAHVLGRWIDLGPIHLFTMSRPIRSDGDLSGLKIRIAGGVVNQMRLEAMGASPVIIAWPELIARLAQKRVDGVLTSYETVASAKVWESGIRFAFEDNEYFGQYVPLVSAAFWERASEGLRRALTDAWEQTVDAERADAARAQEQARRLVESHGVRIVAPGVEELDAWRKRLGSRQEQMIQRLGLDPALAALVPSP